MSVNLLEHALHTYEVVIEYLFGCIKEDKDVAICNRVIDVRAFFPGFNDMLVAKDCKLLRGVGRLDAEHLTDLVDGEFSVPQRIENGNPERVCEGLEELSLKIA